MKIVFSQIASLIILLTSFGQAQTEPPISESPRRVVFLGDSITAGFGLEKAQTYPSLIAQLAEKQGKQWTCINAGLSGDTTNGGVRRVKLLVKRPLDIIIVALGGNDGLRGIAPEVTQKNLIDIITSVKKAQPKVKIILAGIEVPENMGNDYQTKFLNTFTEVAKKTKVHLYPSLIKGISGDPVYNQADMIHPNEKGQAIIAEKIYQEILKVLAK